MAPEGWRELELGEVTENHDHKRIPVKKADRRPGPFPYYGASGIVDYVDDYIFDGEYLLVAEDGENLTTRKLPIAFIADGKFWVNNHAHIIRGNHLADTRFLSCFFRGFPISPFLTGSTRPKLTQGHLNRIPVLIPPLQEQHAIANVLCTLDDKIELNRRMNETLESIARAIFKSWFVDYDPVRAKADGRQPAGMDAETAALFPDSFQDSDLGRIPKCWRTGSLLEQAKLISGGTPKTAKQEYWNGSIPWVSAKDVSQCGQCFLVSTERTITDVGLRESTTKLIPAFSTVIVARGATTGRMSMVGSDMAMNQTCYALSSIDGSDFALYCHVRQVIEALVQTAHGSVFDTVTTTTFQTQRIVLAPQDVVHRYNRLVEPQFLQMLAKEREVRTLSQVRDTLLPKLISGEIRVKDAERFVEEHAG